jgi:trans-aconitate 2-methyltransferase
MPAWDAQQYLKFADERTRPSRDLVARIEVGQPRRVIDLGCGPGNSTQVLAERWPEAEVTGLDSSAEMIATARNEHAKSRWIVAEIGAWAAAGAADFNVVFSNAALQWLPDHAMLLPKLLARVEVGGALAVQVPGNYSGPVHRLMRELSASPGWRRWFPSGDARGWHSHDVSFYYDALAPHAARLDLWETEYLHILPNPEAIVEWYRGSGMRPYLQAIGEESERERFASEYLEGIRPLYPPRPDGRVLFPFRRIFLIAYR